MKIGFVTCSAEKLSTYFPTLIEPHFVPVESCFTPDDQIAVNELRKQGYQVDPIIWGQSIASLPHFDLVIVRSPWDYMDNPENKQQFLTWIADLEQSGTRISNPVSFMLWMLDKHYLRDLQTENVQIIPTQYYEKGAHLNLASYFSKNGPFVLKPCISAAGIGLFYISTIEEALHYQKEMNQQLQQSSYMLQPFVNEIMTAGEWSLIFLGGKYSHAVHKKPGNNSILVHAERGGSLSFPVEPSSSLIHFANDAYVKIFSAFRKTIQSPFNDDTIIYLRLDIIETEQGPVVIECEGVEPELFFRAGAGSEKKFYEAVKKLLG